MTRYRVVCTDQRYLRFALLLGDANDLTFLHWYQLKKHGIRDARAGDEISADMAPDCRALHCRGGELRSAKRVARHADPGSVVQTGLHLDSTQLRDMLLSDSAEPLILDGCTLDNIELDYLNVSRPVAIINCEVTGSFRLMTCQFAFDLFLCNNRFPEHFSLKETHVQGSVHLEGADFSGAGGASFRAASADNLYLDMSVIGPDDFVWLNEIQVPGVIAIGGQFHGDIQLLRRQENEVLKFDSPRIGSIVVGFELYKFENANRTRIRGALDIAGVELTGDIRLRNVHAHAMSFSDVTVHSLSAQSVSTDLDFVLRDSRVTGGPSDPGIALIESSVGRHLKINRNAVSAPLNLNGSSVGEIFYLEGNTLGDDCLFDWRRFSTSRLMLAPTNSLLGTANRPLRILSPPPLARFKSVAPQEQAAQLSALKRWLADAGQLDMEDVALFHMRQASHPRGWRRLVFGGVFGWGVRLTNIAISTLALIALFAVAFQSLGLTPSWAHSLALSAQSFVATIFGQWDGYAPTGLAATLVTLEATLGIVFTTVFVGAYIRKLLR